MFNYLFRFAQCPAVRTRFFAINDPEHVPTRTLNGNSFAFTGSRLTASFIVSVASTIVATSVTTTYPKKQMIDMIQRLGSVFRLKFEGDTMF